MSALAQSTSRKIIAKEKSLPTAVVFPRRREKKGDAMARKEER